MFRSRPRNWEGIYKENEGWSAMHRTMVEKEGRKGKKKPSKKGGEDKRCVCVDEHPIPPREGENINPFRETRAFVLRAILR